MLGCMQCLLAEGAYMHAMSACKNEAGLSPDPGTFALSCVGIDWRSRLDLAAKSTPPYSIIRPGAATSSTNQPQTAWHVCCLACCQEGELQPALRDKAGAAEPSELQALSGRGLEEEGLVQELQALQAARQDLQRASLTQVCPALTTPTASSFR